ncbi:signal transduction histidine kinase [Hamadaea flava]|uniref:histidine kinase n=1 Tax=Hamadaea flava TaxID=1742688 RepID=A0ABV8LS68_9ACTN|nr:histidine kinase [Hamadaea flava]MCP2328304.1 signal transduction histidine kinase [Hamadaea flava]
MDEPGTRPRPWWRVPPIVLDAALAATVAATTLVMVVYGRPGSTEGRALTWLDWLGALVAFGLVLVRRRWPLPVLVLSTAAAVVTVATAKDPAAFVATTVVAAYTVGTHTNRRTAWLAGGISAVVVYATIGTFTDQGWLGPSLGVAAWIGMATAVGDATRSRRAYVAAVEERARRAEQNRDEEARRRVAEERVRIARDLHDVVAHHIAVVNVHAGLAEHSVRTRPEQAETSLRHVRQAAQTVLDELATILAVLRQNGDATAPTEPVRGLAQLDELLASVAAAGLRVEHRQLGSVRPLPAAVDQAAYRIVQEALTNAHKHGSGQVATLCVEYRQDAVVIDVANPAVANPAAANPAVADPTSADTTSADTTSADAAIDDVGHGLTGMRERAVAVGGSFSAGPIGTGRFQVHAVLPSPARPGEVP